LHSLIAYNVNIEKIGLKFYKKILYLIIFPVFIVSLFIHEIIAFSIFFHIFLTFKTIKKKKLLNITPYFFLCGLILFILIFPENNLALEKLNKLALDRGLFLEAMIYASSFSSINSHIAEFNKNFFILYNVKIHFFFIFIATIPLTIIAIYLKNNKHLVFSKSDFLISFILIAPYLIFFAIGDSGRWISLISFTSLGIICQCKISKKIYSPSFANYNFKEKLIYTIISITVFVLCFFIRLPHCCNLEEKKITIWGGISSKIFTLSRILKKDKNDFYDLDKRFKN
jgi:hypothetical protein